MRLIPRLQSTTPRGVTVGRRGEGTVPYSGGFPVQGTLIDFNLVTVGRRGNGTVANPGYVVPPHSLAAGAWIGDVGGLQVVSTVPGAIAALGDLIGYYEVDRLAESHADLDPVGVWRDASGRSNDLAAVGTGDTALPRFEAGALNTTEPGVVTGSYRALRRDFDTLPVGPFLTMQAFKINTTFNPFRIMELQNPLSTTGFMFYYSSSTYKIYDGTGNKSVGGSSYMPVGSPVIVTVLWATSANGGGVRVNGTLTSVDIVGPDGGEASGLTLLGIGDGDNQPFPGPQGDFVLVEGIPSAAAIADAEAHMAAKYGVTLA